MPIVVRILVAGILLTGLLPAAAAPAPKEVAYSLCELVASSAHLANKLVRVRAIFETDMLERSILYDENCPQAHVELYDAKGKQDKSVDKWNRAMRDTYRKGLPVIFQVEFSAMFRVTPKQNDIALVHDDHPRLELFRVWNYSRRTETR
ncbi:MAG TPA: hypothetical protein VGH80_15120 [Xanthomonadaceae bacterium]|jgi:hypothetical protein